MGEGQPPLVGGDTALDFVNTVAWRLAPVKTLERIPTAEALLAWLARVELIGPDTETALRAEAHAEPDVAATVAERVRRLREHAYQVLVAVIEQHPPPAAEVQPLRVAMVDALARARLSGVVPLRWALTPTTLADLPAVLGLALWRFFQFADSVRVRQCADADCGWLFLDASRNASRRWCSSADCGNRARARRHYRRATGAPR